MRRRLVRVFGTGSLLALAAACGGRDGSGGGTAIIALGADSKSLFPTVAAGTVQGRAMVEPMFDPLADLGPTLSTVDVASFAPRLAQSWNWSSDSLTVTFAIDPRARWHDGTPIRAADVRLGYEIARDPAGSTLYLATRAGLYKSVNGGVNWSATAYTATNELATAGGYTAGGTTVAPTVSTASTSNGTVVIVDFADASWAASTFTARGALLYDDTAVGNPAIAVIDFGSDKSCTASTFTVQFPAATANAGFIVFQTILSSV